MKALQLPDMSTVVVMVILGLSISTMMVSAACYVPDEPGVSPADSSSPAQPAGLGSSVAAPSKAADQPPPAPAAVPQPQTLHARQ